MRGPSRRSVLGHIALAGVTASLARPAKGATYDPVFGAIEAHRTASAGVRAACAESDRLCDLADRIAGKHEVILPDFSKAQCYYEIEAYFPGDENKDLRTAYVTKLDERQEARNAVYGDIDAVVNVPAVIECNAIDALVEIAPTTLQGLLTLLVYLAEAHQADPVLICDQHLEPLIANLGEAAATLLS
jgi:hypothetical protein